MDSIRHYPVRTLAALALLCLFGCELTPPSNALLNKPRLLGLELTIDGDPLLAEPSPAQHVEVRLPIASPGASEAASAYFSVCAPGPALLGLTYCGGEPFAFEILSPSRDELAFEFDVPADYGSAGEEGVLLLGAVCFGEVNLALADYDPEDPPGPCADADDLGYLVTAEIPLAQGEPNHDPTLGLVRMDDVVLSESADPTRAGCDPALRVVEADSGAHTLAVEVGGFESYVDDDEELRETLELRTMATGGELERLLTLVESDANAGTLDWTAPSAEEVPEEGLLVKLFLTLRDGRGGFVLAERALCVARTH